MKRVPVLVLSILFLSSIVTSSAFAGSKQRYRWQGVAIGVGAAVLGYTVLNSYRGNHSPERVTVVEHEYHHYSRDYEYGYCHPAPPPRHYYSSCGHWETRRVWVEPAYERVWNPPHYTHSGRWVPGGFIMVENGPSYWSEERVWDND